MLQFQLVEAFFEATPFGLVQSLPGRMGGYVGGGFEKHVEHLAAAVIAQGAVVVVEQHLDANGAFDQRQLLVEQTAGEDVQVAAETLLAFLLRFVAGALVGPYAAPEVPGIGSQRRDEQQAGR